MTIEVHVCVGEIYGFVGFQDSYKQLFLLREHLIIWEFEDDVIILLWEFSSYIIGIEPRATDGYGKFTPQ